MIGFELDGKVFRSKMEYVAHRLTQPEGVTAKELCEALGWPSVAVPQLAKRLGLCIEKAKVNGGPTRYRGVPVDEEAPQPGPDPMNGFFDAISDDYPIFLTALPNKHGGGPIRRTLAGNATDVQKFIEQNDRAGMAIYFAAARLKDGATRRATDTVKETLIIWADVDFKDHPGLDTKEIDRRLRAMLYPPSIIVDSGQGRHLYWLFNEPFDLLDDATKSEFVEALKLLARHVGGDASVCEVARLMRIPGSRNTKDDGE